MTITKFPSFNVLTKQDLVSDIARVIDVLVWYSPTIIKAKICFQFLWSESIELDDPVTDTILEEWT